MKIVKADDRKVIDEKKRDGKNANSALIAQVRKEDFGSDDPLAGVEFLIIFLCPFKIIGFFGAKTGVPETLRTVEIGQVFDFRTFSEKFKTFFILPFFVKGTGKREGRPQIFVSGLRGQKHLALGLFAPKPGRGKNHSRRKKQLQKFLSVHFYPLMFTADQIWFALKTRRKFCPMILAISSSLNPLVTSATVKRGQLIQAREPVTVSIGFFALC